MADLIAYPVTGNTEKLGRPPTVRELDGGMEGECWYRVPNCDDPDKALSATGLPARGAPWSATRPLLTCRERTGFYVAGSTNGATGVGGVCAVQCTFRTPGSGRLPTPQVGQSFVYFQPAVSHTQIIYDIRYGGAQFPVWTDPNASPSTLAYQRVRTPIAGGRGSPITVGAMVACVVSHFTPEAFAAVLPKIMWLQRWQSLNPEPIQLPPVLGTLQRFTMQARQIKYSSCELPQDPLQDASGANLLRVTHLLEIAPDFDFRWKEEDQWGRAFGEEIVSQVYYSDRTLDSFAGLW